MSRRSPILMALAAILAGAMPALPAAAQFGGLGNIGSMLDRAKSRAQTVKKIGDGLRSIDEPEEIKLGGDLAATLLGTAPLVEDPALQHYVNRLGRWLAMHSERPGLPWKFGVIDNDGFNAFSMPGGYVLITRGLFERMRNESELAGVLAHEIAHVVRKHQLSALQKSMQSSALGEMNDYFRGGGGGIGKQFATALINSGKEMFVRGLDREDEFEADRMGVVIAARAGYSPYGLAGVLQTLSAAPQDGDFALMFRTHPAPVDRIDRLDSAMGTQLDGLTGLAEDLPGFVALRAPPPPPAAKPAPVQRRTGRR